MRWIGEPAVYSAAGRARMAHHPLQVEPADQVALRPRREDVAVAVLRNGAGEAVVGVVDHGVQRHVAAVAGTEDGDSRRVDPVQRGEVVVGGEAVVRVGHAPHAMVGALEVAAVAWCCRGS